MGMSTFQPQSISALHPAKGRDQGHFEDTPCPPPTPQGMLMYVSTYPLEQKISLDHYIMQGDLIFCRKLIFAYF